jgi:NADH-quinone oxidoreductase subunit J
MILNNLILLCSLVLAALWTVMTVRLIRSVVGLALTSVILSVMMYRLHSPLAAVFELSVCAGLISVIFITTVGFTSRLSKEMLPLRRRERFIKFWYLPFIVVVAGLLLSQYVGIPQLKLPLPVQEQNVRNILWNLRHLDLLGQIVMLLAGAFGVAVFFKEFQK